MKSLSVAIFCLLLVFWWDTVQVTVGQQGDNATNGPAPDIPDTTPAVPDATTMLPPSATTEGSGTTIITFNSLMVIPVLIWTYFSQNYLMFTA